MTIQVTAEGQDIHIQAAALRLEGITPLVNGAPAPAWEGEWSLAGDGARERIGALGPGGPLFAIRLEPGPGPGEWSLYTWLEGFPLQTDLDSFGLRLDAIYGLFGFLRSGYTSWDGSAYLAPAAAAGSQCSSPVAAAANDGRGASPTPGYALTQLLPAAPGPSLLLGFDRHDRFQHTFTLHSQGKGFALDILTLWDRKLPSVSSPVRSERLILLASLDPEDGLRRWAGYVAQAAPLPPRITTPVPLTGWCSWYNLYAAITEENLREHLQAAAAAVRSRSLPLHIFQIDDGFTPEMGDWLEVRPQFPHGMQPLLDEIRAAGFLPGLWIAPFMVGNRSRLYARRPDWVVQDARTGGPLVQMRFYGEFRWHKRSEEYYILDITHPEAYAYIAQVFRTWRQDWGCEYFKTDFMLFGSEHGPQTAAWHTPGLTRIEIWRRMAELIRSEIGEAVWLGCGSPLWAATGLVDAVRTGRDTGVEWDLRTPEIFANGAARNFAHGLLWQADPDCILLRQRYHALSDQELESLALFAGLAGGVRMTSDHLGELSPERMRLWEAILSWPNAACRYPLLSQMRLLRVDGQPGSACRLEDPLVVQVKPLGPGEHLVHLLNSGAEPLHRELPFSTLGLASAGEYALWPGFARFHPARSIRVDLEPHESTLCLVRDRVEDFPGPKR